MQRILLNTFDQAFNPLYKMNIACEHRHPLAEHIQHKAKRIGVGGENISS